jgi:uncharacterized membrane protein
MKTAKVFVGLAAVLALAVVVSVQAEEKKDEGKEVTLKGVMSCGKCTLGICAKCTNALTVEEDGKKMVYLLEDKGTKEKYHKAICPPNSTQKATVTGTVTAKPSGDKPGKIKPKEDGVKID